MMIASLSWLEDLVNLKNQKGPQCSLDSWCLLACQPFQISRSYPLGILCWVGFDSGEREQEKPHITLSFTSADNTGNCVLQKAVGRTARKSSVFLESCNASWGIVYTLARYLKLPYEGSPQLVSIYPVFYRHHRYGVLQHILTVAQHQRQYCLFIFFYPF